MHIDPTFKLAIVPAITRRIFPTFNEFEYNNKLDVIIRMVASYENVKDAVSILYKDNFYTPYDISQVNFKYVRIKESHACFDEFINLIESKNKYKELTASASNYLRNGFAICNSTNDMCEVFPQFILDTIKLIIDNESVDGLIEKPTEKNKIISFKQRNEQLVESLKKQIVFNIIAPGSVYANNDIQ